MAKERRKLRNFSPLSLAFLDVMSCGFGAVVLIFLILDHSASVRSEEGDRKVSSEVALLEEEILQGEEGLVRVRNTLSDIDFRVVEASGLAKRIQEQIKTFLEELAFLEENSLANQASIEKLKADIKALEEEEMRLQAELNEEIGEDVRRYVGDGDRQYLTGLILGGKRILILLDVSASMLDNTIVNIIRRRNMSDEVKRQSGKWQRIVSTVDWLSAQLPFSSQYQIYTFNSDVMPVVEGSEGQWLEVADRDQLEESIENIKQIIPSGGTNMQGLFLAVQHLSPLPDNIYLITDGLPTQGNKPSKKTTITGKKRYQLYKKALKELPKGIPVNIILAPLEGDPQAASAFWVLAQVTKGSFLSPSRDWP